MGIETIMQNVFRMLYNEIVNHKWNARGYYCNYPSFMHPSPLTQEVFTSIYPLSFCSVADLGGLEMQQILSVKGNLHI